MPAMNPGYLNSGYPGYSGNQKQQAPLDFKDRPGGSFHTWSLVHLIFWPVLIFSIISIFYAYLFHNFAVLVIIIITMCFLLSVVFMLAPHKRQNAPSYWFNTGVLCLISLVLSIACGMYNFNRHIGIYWLYDGQRSYSNVRADEPALAHIDAGKIEFASNAIVAVSQGIGYKDGNTYCVAPVISKDSSQKRIEYWAAGMNCCEENGGSFDCHDSKNAKAHGGLVYLDDGPTGIFLPGVEDYKKAAEKAVSKYGLSQPQDVLFVRWVENPSKAQRRYFHEGVGFLWISIAVYLVVSIGAGLVLHFGLCGGHGRQRTRSK